MNIQQISNEIVKNNWDFTLVKTAPDYEVLLKNYKCDVNPHKLLISKIRESGATQVEIEPIRRNGSSWKRGFAKKITLDISTNNSNNNNKNTYTMEKTGFEALAGLNGLGLSMAEIFTAKEKTNEVQHLKAEVSKLEKEVKDLEKENAKLEQSITINEIKQAQKNELLETIKSPQILGLATALLSRGTTSPALNGATSEPTQQEDEKIRYITNFLEDATTPEITKDFFIYITRAHQDENAKVIVKELAETLIKHGILQQN